MFSFEIRFQKRSAWKNPYLFIFFIQDQSVYSFCPVALSRTVVLRQLIWLALWNRLSFWWEEVEKSGDVQTTLGVFLVDHEPHSHQCNLKNNQASINPGYDLHQTNEAFFSKFIYIYLYLYCMFLCWFDLCLFTLICI